jgi:hypothetical protein
MKHPLQSTIDTGGQHVAQRPCVSAPAPLQGGLNQFYGNYPDKDIRLLPVTTNTQLGKVTRNIKGQAQLDMRGCIPRKWVCYEFTVVMCRSLPLTFRVYDRALANYIRFCKVCARGGCLLRSSCYV